MTSSAPVPRPEDEVVEICRRLITIDTTNYGDGTGPGEREAAEYIRELLHEVGYEPQLIDSDPGRTSVFLRIPGTQPERPALVVHGHTDVVPAEASEWRYPPFSAELVDGIIWGRGAVDMKGMDAMILAVIRDMARRSWQPLRDLIIAFFADEEAGGVKGSHWMVTHHPELFAGATEAISEVGGYSVQIAGQRAYLLQTAEKGLAWLRLLARGTAGHGSQVNPDNAVTQLAAAMARIGNHEWPLKLTPTVRQLLHGVAELTGVTFDEEDPEAIDKLLEALGPAAKFVGATLRTGANPTQLSAGYKANVIPQAASGTIDVRFLPGEEDDVRLQLKELAGPNVAIEDIHSDIAVEAPFAGDLVEEMIASLHAEDPGAVVLPYMLSGGTDNKALSRLGIAGYGFAPLQLPPDLDFAGMFHGVDERVPVSSLRFGTRVLERFLRRA